MYRTIQEEDDYQDMKYLEELNMRTKAMPYTSKQHKLFESAAHSKSIAKQFGIKQSQAKQMAAEGVKSSAKAKNKK